MVIGVAPGYIEVRVAFRCLLETARITNSDTNILLHCRNLQVASRVKRVGAGNVGVHEPARDQLEDPAGDRAREGMFELVAQHELDLARRRSRRRQVPYTFE